MAPIVPMAMLAGAGLAIGNAIVDLDGDHALGRRTVAVALGRPWAWAVHGALLAGVVVWLVALEPLGGGTSASPGAAVGLMAGGLVLIGGGIILLGIARRAGARLGWALEAAGVGLLGVGWVIAAAAG